MGGYGTACAAGLTPACRVIPVSTSSSYAKAVERGQRARGGDPEDRPTGTGLAAAAQIAPAIGSRPVEVSVDALH